MLAYDERLTRPGALTLHEPIQVRMPGNRFPEARSRPARRATTPRRRIVVRRYDDGGVLVESSLGRLLFNEAFPERLRLPRRRRAQARRRALVGRLVDGYPLSVVAESLDELKRLGFRFSTQAGLTISMSDVKTPSEKPAILEGYEARADKIESQYDRGIITDSERRQKEIEIWTEATQEVQKAMQASMAKDPFNPIEMMVGSGARGNVMQVRQIAGMRGLVANPKGEIIPRPIKSNFREGLSVLEYFISTHGARKGLADTALRTADSGYLTRRLVDVAQELIVREDDCGTTRGLWVEDIVPERRARHRGAMFGRVLVDDVALADGTVLAKGTYLRDPELQALLADEVVNRVRVRSVLTCETTYGVCGLCYGLSLATGREVELGEAIGIIAAQSIGEPGTQLTMRTFHTGGVAGEDITHGLPRVVELFEARTPKGKATMGRLSGVVRLGEDDKGNRTITVVADDGTEDVYAASPAQHLTVARGPAGRRRPAPHRRRQLPARPQGDPRHPGRPGDPALPRRRGAEGLPGAGRGDRRQAHRGDRPPDAAAGGRLGVGRLGVPAGREGRLPALRPGQPVAARGRAPSRRGPPRADGDHQGVAGHRLVAVRGVVPGDHAGAHRGGHRGPQRRARGPQGERDHRQAHPRRHRHDALPERHRPSPPTPSPSGPAPWATTRTSPSTCSPARPVGSTAGRSCWACPRAVDRVGVIDREGLGGTASGE